MAVLIRDGGRGRCLEEELIASLFNLSGAKRRGSRALARFDAPLHLSSPLPLRVLTLHALRPDFYTQTRSN